MTLTNEAPRVQTDQTLPARLHALDMEVAARTSLPVLISAPPESAFPMAMAIALATEDGADSVVVVDGEDSRYLQSALIRAASTAPGRLRAIVVHDVDALDRAQQSTLMALVADGARPGSCACRIIATTSVPLFERVLEGSFDSALFYRLNTIHIKTGAPMPQDD